MTSPTSNHALWVDATICPRREQTFFAEMKQAGVAAAVVTSPHWDSGFYKGVQDVAGDLRWIEDSEGEAILATTVEDIRRAHDAGKVAILLAPQDGKIIEDQLDFLRVFYGLGIRILELTHMFRNFIGDGTIDSHRREDTGLSSFGVEVVREMNRLGMVVDLAHSGHQTTMDAIDESAHPVIFSHTCANALTPNFRNKEDQAIKALAAKGGVMGLTPIAPFCEIQKGVWPTMDDFLKHVDYVAELVGVDHIAISLDIDYVWYEHLKGPQGLTYEGGGLGRQGSKNRFEHHVRMYEGLFDPPYIDTETCPMAKGTESIACYPTLADALSARGYSEQDVAKILGGNLLRVFEEVWGS